MQCAQACALSRHLWRGPGLWEVKTPRPGLPRGEPVLRPREGGAWRRVALATSSQDACGHCSCHRRLIATPGHLLPCPLATLPRQVGGIWLGLRAALVRDGAWIQIGPLGAWCHCAGPGRCRECMGFLSLRVLPLPPPPPPISKATSWFESELLSALLLGF